LRLKTTPFTIFTCICQQHAKRTSHFRGGTVTTLVLYWHRDRAFADLGLREAYAADPDSNAPLSAGSEAPEN
jgi:hypothetical protein